MTGAVISGPTGAIGMALIEKCIRENTRVLAICHKGSARIKNMPQSPLVQVVEADLADYKQLFRQKNAAMHQFDVFYHLRGAERWERPETICTCRPAILRMTMDAVELAERLGCHTFIGAGSQAEYGRVDGKLTPDLPAHPENGYGMAKLCARGR